MSPLLESWRNSAPKDPPVAIRLLEILRHLDRHDTACCQWVLSLLVFLWQQTGLKGPGPVPSLLLVNGSSDPGPPEADPILSPLFAAFKHNPAKPAYGNVDETSAAYRQMIEGKQWMATFLENGGRAPETQALAWDKARATVYGSSSIAAYQGRWHPMFGVLTPTDQYRIFSVASAQGFEQFRKDLLNPNVNPFRPEGLDGSGIVHKHAPIIGSIPATAFDESWADQVAVAGSPLLLGPYTSVPVTNLPYQKEIHELVVMLGSALQVGSESCVRQNWIPLTTEAVAYENVIRSFLRHLPGDYEYFVLNTWRILSTVSYTLLKTLRLQRVDDRPMQDLVRHLAIRSARGLAMGLELLSYRGTGLEIHGMLPKRWQKLLRVLRASEPAILQRELQRAVGGITSDQLKVTLADLERARLVKVDGKYSQAVSLGEFMKGLGRGPGFPKAPPPPKQWNAKTLFSSQPSVRRKGGVA